MANFAQQMKRWAANTNRTVEKTIEDAVLELGLNVIERTPIGDPSLWQRPAPPGYVPGTLINSWFSGDTPATPGNTRGPKASAADSRAQLRAAAPLAPGKVFYITNPAPYARRIEFGHSTQAPQGMVRLAVIEFKAIMARAARKNRK